MMGNGCTSEVNISIEPDENITAVSQYISHNRSFESYTREQCCHLYDESGNFIPPVAEAKNPEQIMKKLEAEGTRLAKETLIDTTSTSTEAADKLIGFMSDGAKRFEKETGRSMTYSEMREMWG